MWVALIFLYFLLACGLAWLLFFPAGREAVAQIWETLRARLARAREPSHSPARKTLGLAHSAQRLTTWLRRHTLALSLALVVVSSPVLLAVFLGGNIKLDTFDDSERVIDSRVKELLEGEQLVPPPPLPPEVFSTAEVEQVRPLLASASRNWQLLNPEFEQRLLLVFKIMKEKYGYEVALLEGYRSPERQNLLAASGNHVTNAAAFQSYHQYGLAADCAFLRNGRLVISERDPWAMEGYQRYGEVAESVGLTWGGRWKLMDYGHIELRIPGVIKRR